MKHCGYCGTQIKDAGKFCPLCGRSASGQDTVTSKKYCGKCGSAMLAQAKFCPKCGKPTDNRVNQTGSVLCKNCGKSIPARAKFCPYCAKQINGVVVPPKPPKKRRAWIAAVAAMLVVCISIGAVVLLRRVSEYKKIDQIYSDILKVNQDPVMLHIYQDWADAAEKNREELRAEAITYLQRLERNDVIQDVIINNEYNNITYTVDGIQNVIQFNNQGFLFQNSFLDSVSAKIPIWMGAPTNDNRDQNVRNALNYNFLHFPNDAHSEGNVPEYSCAILSADLNDAAQLERKNNWNEWMTTGIHNFKCKITNYDYFTVSDLKQLKDFDIILINSHGAYINGSTPYIVTAEEVTDYSLKREFKLNDFEVISSISKGKVKGEETQIVVHTNIDSGISTFGVKGSFFAINYNKTGMNAKWVHLGVCCGLKGYYNIGNYLHLVSVNKITGYNESVSKQYEYWVFQYLLNGIDRGASFSDAVDYARRKTRTRLIDLASEGMSQIQEYRVKYGDYSSWPENIKHNTVDFYKKWFDIDLNEVDIDPLLEGSSKTRDDFVELFCKAYLEVFPHDGDPNPLVQNALAETINGKVAIKLHANQQIQLSGTIKVYRVSPIDSKWNDLITSRSSKSFKKDEAIRIDDLEVGETYKIVIDMKYFQTVEMEFLAENVLKTIDASLVYEGGGFFVLSPVGEKTIHFFVVEEQNIANYITNAKIDLYGKIEHSSTLQSATTNLENQGNSEYNLVLSKTSSDKGEFKEVISNEYNWIKCEVSCDGYNTVSIEDSSYSSIWNSGLIKLSKKITSGNNDAPPQDINLPVVFDPEIGYTALFQAKIAELVAKYGVMAGEPQVKSNAGDKYYQFLWTGGETEGMLFADIFDYDGDGAPELLTCRNLIKSSGREGDDRFRDNLTLEIFEADANGCQLADSKVVSPEALSLGIPGTAISIFRYENNDAPAIGVMCETDSGNDWILAVLSYGYYGKSLFLNGGTEWGEWPGSYVEKEDETGYLSTCLEAISEESAYHTSAGSDTFKFWNVIASSGSRFADPEVFSAYRNNLSKIGLAVRQGSSLWEQMSDAGRYGGTYDAADPYNEYHIRYRNAADSFTALAGDLTVLGNLTSEYFADAKLYFAKDYLYKDMQEFIAVGNLTGGNYNTAPAQSDSQPVEQQPKASADASEQELREKVMKAYKGTGDILAFGYSDYAWDGKHEAFALIGVYDDATFNNAAEL